MPDTPVASPRVVPGAPPPVSKPQKKKRKGGKAKEESEGGSHLTVPDTTTAALIDKAPEEIDLKEGVVAPQLMAQVSEGLLTPARDGKQSPIVDMVSKRLKANNKKITRIQTYQNEPLEKLNDDQKRLLKQLPTLEAVSKELEEVKKAIEQHEQEIAQDIAFQRAEAARIEAEKAQEAMAAAEAENLAKTIDLITFIRLQEMLSRGHPDAVALDLNETEESTIHSITEALKHEKTGGKVDIVRGLFTGEGEHLGVPFARIRDIQERFLRPPPVQSPPPPEPQPHPVDESDIAPVSGIPPTVGASEGIRFMMADELAEVEAEVEAATGTQPESEWVEVEAKPPAVEITETVVETEMNGHTVVEDVVTITTTTEMPSAQLNWADEDHGELPPLDNLQAHYGTSTETSPPVVEAESPSVQEAPGTPRENGQGPFVDEEGFTQHRGRGRGRGFRGGERGGFRGFRGERGGERGGFRGGERGGFRGGERGERGGRGFRGGERGGFRGRSDGEWRPRGGRGRGRGSGFGEPRGGAPSPPAAA